MAQEASNPKPRAPFVCSSPYAAAHWLCNCIPFGMTSGGWESIFEGQRVVVVEPVVRDLRRLAIEGFLALPRRGIEVGGILFGETNSKGIRIQCFE